MVFDSMLADDEVQAIYNAYFMNACDDVDVETMVVRAWACECTGTLSVTQPGICDLPLRALLFRPGPLPCCAAQASGVGRRAQRAAGVFDPSTLTGGDSSWATGHWMAIQLTLDQTAAVLR